MIPIPSLGGLSIGATVLALLVALAPAIVTWWTDRGLIARHDDPALPELIAGRRRTMVVVIAVSMAFLLVFSGSRVAWGIPLLLAALAAAAYPFRTQLLGETWSFPRYLWHAGLSLVGGFGFWIALIYAPILVREVLDLFGPSRLLWGAAAAALVAAALFAWEALYPRIWLWTHAARPLVDDALTPRFDEIVRRAGTPAPTVHRVGPQGSRFVNAVALPSLPRPAVAIGDALLDLLDPDETAAIFAHEVAHFDHFTPAYVRRVQLINRLLIIVGVSLPLLAAVQGGGWANWIGWVWPFVVVTAIVRRSAKSQQRETESDLRAAALCGDPEALVRGLAKLYVDARIPRRYAVDSERAATHPSLVRRIQAIRASVGAGDVARQLGSTTVVQSTRPGSWVAIDDLRAYWLDGVPAGTPAELAALRDAASSYRALNYADMVELRVAASGDARAIKARTRTGDSWSIPIAREDVARVQAALDVVDLRIGKIGTAPAAAAPRFIAIVTAAIVIVAGQVGIVLVPIALALWKAGPATMAALGAMSITRAALGLFESPVWLDEALVRLGLLALGVIGVGALYTAHRMIRADDAHRHVRLTTGVLVALVVLVGVALAWRIVETDEPIVGAPLAGTLATALAGLAAALFTVRASWSRPAAFAGIVAAVAIATSSVDRSGWKLQHALVEASATATPDAQTEVGSTAYQLRVSPAGTYFMVTRVSTARQRALNVLLARVGAPARELPAVAGEFVDSTHVLLVDMLENGIELRLEHIDSVGRGVWVDTLTNAEIDDPRLSIDREANSLAIMAADPTDDQTVVLAGTIGQRGSTRRVVVPDSVAVVGGPIVFGPASTVLIPTYAAASGSNYAVLSSLSMLGANALRSELRRVSDGTLTRVGSMRGFPQCGEPTGGVVACAARHHRGTSLYTIDSAGTVAEIARLAGQEYGIVVVGPGLRASSMRFDRSIAAIDLAARRLTRIALPPNTVYAAEVNTGPGFVVTLEQGENRRATVRRYTVR